MTMLMCSRSPVHPIQITKTPFQVATAYGKELTQISHDASLFVVFEAFSNEPLPCMHQIGPTCNIDEIIGIGFEIYCAEAIV